MNAIMQAMNFPEEIISKYEIIQEMGRGAFSTVYKIKSKLDNNIYCLKKINIKKTPDRNNEINILSKLNHPNLVQYISSCCDDDGIYIVMEFCIYGDLYSLLHMVKKKKVYVNEEIVWDIAYQCLLGLEYLHSQNIIHRDIKLLNIFMSKNKSVKIGDMGMAKILSNKEMKLSRVGTPLYLAPELVRKEKYDFKADIWSLGCSLYHLARTIPPFNDENLIRLGQAIVNENPATLPSCYSNQLNIFINKLMTKDKKLRPSATEALQLIPQKTKSKFDISNYPNQKLINSYSIHKNEKNNKKIKKNSNISNKSNPNINISNNKNNNDNNFKTNNELVSGQTFYKFFKKNSFKSDRTKSKINFLSTKNGNISSSQNIAFDSKNMNSYLIMSKTMGGTKEGFFKHKNVLFSSGPGSKETNINLNSKESKEFYPHEEEKTLDTNNENNTKNDNIDKNIQININNNEQINNFINEEIKNDYKPLIIKHKKMNENDKKAINKEKENIIIDSKMENKTKSNKYNEEENKDKNNVNKLKDDNSTFSNNIFNFNNYKNKESNWEIRNINNFFNKKRVNKNKSGIDFFNNFGLIKSYQKEIPKNRNIFKKDDYKNKEIVSFPIIESKKKGNIISQRLNNNSLLEYNKMGIFRRTVNGFPFQNKLTIHDLK